MAEAERLAPFILKWETGTVKEENESMEAYFGRCRKNGYANDPSDAGGATMCGVTLSTYRCFKGCQGITATQLKRMTYQEWYKIFKTMYWDRWKADNIISQGIANILVDWVWGSGRYGITRPQRLLGVKADGIVGAKTLAALNSRSPLPLWAAIKADRKKYIDQIIAARPLNAKFRTGWMNRLNDLKYTE